MNHCIPLPTLDDLLSDPLVRMVMDRDGVEPESVRRLMGEAARRITPARSRGSGSRAA